MEEGMDSDRKDSGTRHDRDDGPSRFEPSYFCAKLRRDAADDATGRSVSDQGQLAEGKVGEMRTAK